VENKVFCIVGPTGVGKTDFAIYIATHINAEIINADSMQIYRYMNIGTAKPSKEQLGKVKHYLIDIIDPDEPFNVKDYTILAEEKIREVYSKGKVPILVGGTGFYFKALLEGIFDAPSKDEELRKKLLDEINEIGEKEMHHKLSNIDPRSASKIHPNDKKRIIRAFEVYILTGRPMSEAQKEQAIAFNPSFNYELIGITNERSIVYDRIEKRCDKMIADGFVDEVIKTTEMGYHSELQSMKAIGYSNIHSYLNGGVSYDEMIRLFKRDSRRYAKRQWTFFNAIKQVKWIKIDWEKDLSIYLENYFK